MSIGAIALYAGIYLVIAAVSLGLHLSFATPPTTRWGEVREVLVNLIWPLYWLFLAWALVAIWIHKLVQAMRQWGQAPGGLLRRTTTESVAEAPPVEPLRAPPVIPGAALYPSVYDPEEEDEEDEVDPGPAPNTGERRGQERDVIRDPLLYA